MTSSSRHGESLPAAGQATVPGGASDSGRAPASGDDPKTIISSRPPLAAPGQVETEERMDAGRFAPGDMLGPYELVEYIGGGGMGCVYRALDTQLNRIVALKVLPRERAADMETLLRFRNEARSAARLDHDSVVRVYFVGEDRTFPYLVFEFIEGETIRALVERGGPLRLADALSYTLQIADVLTHAAERGVVHRDIKPSNVMITPQGRAKVIDLGLARLGGASDAENDLTASGVTLGTFDYISPEQARDPRTVDVRSDIYSLGCAFFYMLSGRPPFPEGTVLQKLLQHQGDKPPDVQQFRPELPDEVSQVIRKMLAKDPGDRYQTSLALIEDLQVLAEHVGMRPRMPGDRVWMAPRGRPFSALQRHLPWMAPVAALLGIVALLHFWWTSPAGSPPGPSPPAVATAPPMPAEELVSSPPDAEPSKRADPAEDKPAKPPAALPATTPPAAPAAAPSGQGVASMPGEAGPPSPPAAPASADQVPWAGLGPEPNAAGLAAAPHTASTLGGEGGREGFTFSSWPLSDLFPLKGSPETRPAVEAAPPKLSGVLTVGDPGMGGRNFATLAAAASAAESGDIIELRYHGRREEKPILLPNAKLVIRAGQGFQPVVVFRPNDPDPVKYPRTMVSLTGSELALLNVAVEMDIPRDVPADRWTLLELGRAESLRLEKCSLTIRNAYHQEVAFFRVKTPAGADVLAEGAASSSEQAAKITLTDCIVRGEAVVVRAESLQPVHFAWTNGLLLTSEQLLWAAGGDTMPGPGQDIRIQLKHLTATIEAGLCRLDNRRFGKYQLPTQVDCSDSILMASVDSPLVEQIGEKGPEGSRGPFTWNGDRNFYQGFIVFWKMDDLDPATPLEPMEFEAWQSRWFPDHEIHSRWGRVDFRHLPEAAAPLDARTPLDYMLSDSVENWARSAASDGTDVGFSADRLPPLPPAPGKP